MQVILFFMINLISAVFAKQDLITAYQWREMDFQFDTVEQRSQAINEGQFIPKNVIPYGMEIFNDMLYITLPRWRSGVPASLAYINLKENKVMGPALKPYPNWAAHDMTIQDPFIVSPMRVRADSCGRLWVLDTRTVNVLDSPRSYGSTQLLIFDLHTNKFIQKIVFPTSHQTHSYYASLAIEDTDCFNTYAYAGDMKNPYLMVFSHKTGDFWRIENPSFLPEKVAGHQLIKDFEMQWKEGLYEVAIVHTANETSLYYHSLSSLMEHKVITELLHNKSEALSFKNADSFKAIGTRPPLAEAGATVFHKPAGVVFFTLPNIHGIGFVSAYSEQYECSVLTTDRDLMPFPSALAIDENNRLWVLSSDLHAYMNGELEENGINFRILGTTLPGTNVYKSLKGSIVDYWKEVEEATKAKATISATSSILYSILLILLLYSI